MIFHEPDIGAKDHDLASLIKTIDPMFKAGWEPRAPDILHEMQLSANNYRLLNGFVHGKLKDKTWPPMQGAQSFLLHKCDDYYIRINLWFPPRVSPVEDQIKKYFSIELIHNHNFPLLTVGLFGPGYATNLSWWDNPKTGLQVGDKIKIGAPVKKGLPFGAGLYMQKDHDFHEQLWPEAFSISLNVIPARPADTSPLQYILNDDLTIRETIQAGSNTVRKQWG